MKLTVIVIKPFYCYFLFPHSHSVTPVFFGRYERTSNALGILSIYRTSSSTYYFFILNARINRIKNADFHSSIYNKYSTAYGGIQ